MFLRENLVEMTLQNHDQRLIHKFIDPAESHTLCFLNFVIFLYTAASANRGCLDFASRGEGQCLSLIDVHTNGRGASIKNLTEALWL